MLNQEKLYHFFPKPGFSADFLYTIYTINLAERQLYIATWDEEWSCEAAMGWMGARSVPFRVLTSLERRVRAARQKPTKSKDCMYKYTSGADASFMERMENK
jgi:hypothetical protein